MDNAIYIHILDAAGLRDFDPALTPEDADQDAADFLHDAMACIDTGEAAGYFAGGWSDVKVRVHSSMRAFDEAAGAMVPLSYFRVPLGNVYGYHADDPRVCYVTTDPFALVGLGVDIDPDVCNVNTVQDAAARLRNVIRNCGADSPRAATFRQYLRNWIAHALAGVRE